MRKHLLLLSFLAICALLSHQAQAIGVSPASYSVDFKPGLKTNFYFDFFQDNEIPLEIYAEGELARYVKLSTKSITGDGSVTVALTLPKEAPTPGTNTIHIGARQRVEERGFGLTGNVRGLIHVIVPYPGQYATFSIKAHNANVGEQVNFSATIKNLGDEEVGAQAKIAIYQGGTHVTDLDLGEFDLSSPDARTVDARLDTANYAPGNYLALGELTYGSGNLARSNATFRLGELFLRIARYSDSLERDKLNKFDIEVESEWNDPIPSVYANVTLQNYPVSFLTPSVDIAGFGSATLTGFFDTSGIQEENFQALIKVHYGGKTTEQLVTLRFNKEIDYMLIGLIAAVVIILGLVIFVTYVLRKASQGRKGRR